MTGLYYDHARYYDAVIGRFVSQDPKGFAAGDADLYRYVGNEPTVGMDPSGLQIIGPTAGRPVPPTVVGSAPQFVGPPSSLRNPEVGPVYLVPPGFEPPTRPVMPGTPNPIYLITPGAPGPVRITGSPIKYQNGPITIVVLDDELLLYRNGPFPTHLPRQWITQPIDITVLK